MNAMNGTIRVHHISDVREHIKEKHESKFVSIIHAKLDRKDKNFVKETRYRKEELFN